MEYNIDRCKNYVINQAGNAIDALIEIYGLNEFHRMIRNRMQHPIPSMSSW